MTTLTTIEEKFDLIKKKEFYLVSITLMFILVFGSMVSDTDFQNTAVIAEPEKGNIVLAGTPHDPIVINGDANFSETATAEGWLGDGSDETPYIIDSLNIDRGGVGGHCIYINNTRVNFTISNCILTGAPNPYSGICLDNVSYGALIDNTCVNNYIGIFLYESNFNSIQSNNCTINTSVGIRITNGNYNNVTRNSITQNSDAIYLESGSDLNRIGHNTITNCANGIYLNSGINNMIFDNNCSNGTYGIILSGSTLDVTVSNNTCTDNSFGIILSSANGGSIINNTCSENVRGIYIDGSTSSLGVHNNTCIGNSDIGIYFEMFGGGGTATWNVLADNFHNAVDAEGGAIFDYNFYSDYTGLDANLDGIGDTPYSSSMYDPHPLMYIPTPPRWMELPSDQTIELGEVFFYFLNVTSPSPLTWWVNDTFNFVFITDSILVSLNTDFDTCGLEIVVTNIYGDFLTSEFILHVEDHTPPIWIVAPLDTTTEIGDVFVQRLGAWDESGIDHWWLNSTSHFSIDENGVIRNTTLLEAGIYNLEVRVYDPYGAYCSAFLVITVLDTSTPTTTTPTTTTTTTTPTTTTTTTVEGIDSLVTLALGAGIGGISVLVVIFIFLKRKP